MDDFDAATQDTSQLARRHGAIRPVTIRQLALTKLEEELVGRSKTKTRYSLNGDEFDLATFVGHVINVDVSGPTTRTIRIDDGTGKITSTYMIDEDEEAEDPPRWREGAYARVVGIPRKFKNTVVFSIYFIRAVEDPHEVFFHLMEAMVVTLQHSRGPPPRLYNSQYAKTTGAPMLPPQSQPLRVAPAPQVADEPFEDSQDSVIAMPSYSVEENSSDAGDGSTEYYTDDEPDPPFEWSPSPTPVHPLARNHSHEGHSDREEGPSSQPSQLTAKPGIRSDDEGDVDGKTPKGKSKSRRRDDSVPNSPKMDSDDELDLLRSELSSSHITPPTPPRLKPDPYADWSPAKRKIMVFIRSKNPGEEVNVRKSLGSEMPRMEIRNAIKELVKEGEIETEDDLNYRLTQNGPKYPRI